MERLDRKIKREGIIRLLKNGLDIDDAHFTLYYSLPFNDLNPDIATHFAQNIFSVTRQIHYAEADPLLSIDMVLFLNGLAIATFELKNPWTHQTTYHACRQYEKRNVKETLLNFARCLVHFAVDTDDIYMTTRLDGKKTFFLPFNKGYNYGKGNPPNPFGHKTIYLWEEVLTRQSLTNIIEHFAIWWKKKDPLTKKRLFFPRYHQLEVVRRLLAHAREPGPGQTYLIQHSAGSGKSNSITWTAYQLIELYADGADRPVFDSVVVVTDRRMLDKQLRDNIKHFSEVKNIVAPAMSSQELKPWRRAKKSSSPPSRNFPFIVDGIDDFPTSLRCHHRRGPQLPERPGGRQPEHGPGRSREDDDEARETPRQHPQ